LQRFGNPRHTSMYIMLLPCAFFLFGLLRGKQGKRSPFMRDVSLWIYILHPLLIVAVRGGMRILGFTDVLAGNNIMLFLCVTVLSLTCAMVIGLRERIALQLGTMYQLLFKHRALYRL